MTPVWHNGPLSTLRCPPSTPVVWSVRLTSPAASEALAVVRASTLDFSDAARGGGEGARRLARRLVGRALVARLAGCHSDMVKIDRKQTGAPVVVTPLGWHIGFSARNDNCLIGAARFPIAVDRESLDGAIVLADMLTPAEAKTIDLALPPDQRLQWMRRWTIKEAFAKLTSAPRMMRPETIETVLNEDGTAMATHDGRIALCWSRVHDGGVETMATWATSSWPQHS